MEINKRIHYYAHSTFTRQNAILNDKFTDEQKNQFKAELIKIRLNSKKYGIETEVADMAYQMEMDYNDKIIRESKAWLAANR